MSIVLRQSTASQEVPLGHFLDNTDGDTEETGLTIANTDIKIWKTGATTLANKNSGGATHISNGVYYAVLDDTDTDTLGPLVIFVHVSGALAVRLECVVLSANVYDSLIAASDDLDVQVAGVDNDAITAAAIAENAITASELADGAITAAKIATDAITAAKIATDAIGSDELADAAVAKIAADLLPYFQLLARADANLGTDLSTELSELNADTGTTGAGSFDNTADSQEAIRNRGDAAWTTGGGGSITDLLNVTPLVPYSIDLANTATWRVGLQLTNALDDLPSTAEIAPGTIDIDRKAAGGTSWSSVVSGAACSELAGLIYYDEVFDSGAGYAEGDSIRITFYNQKITVSANDYEISDANGRVFYTEIRESAAGSSFDYTTDPVIVGAINAAGLADLFDVDSTKVYADAVSGSVVKEIGEQTGGATAAQVWQYVIESGATADTAEKLMRLWAAIFLGKTNRGNGNQIVFRDQQDSKDRATFTLDVNGMRTAVSIDDVT